MVAVLARLQGGTIHIPRTGYFPVLPDKKELNNRFGVKKNCKGKIERKEPESLVRLEPVGRRHSNP